MAPGRGFSLKKLYIINIIHNFSLCSIYHKEPTNFSTRRKGHGRPTARSYYAYPSTHHDKVVRSIDDQHITIWHDGAVHFEAAPVTVDTQGDFLVTGLPLINMDNIEVDGEDGEDDDDDEDDDDEKEYESHQFCPYLENDAMEEDEVEEGEDEEQ